MAKEILSFFKRKPYFNANADTRLIRKVALNYALETGQDIDSCLSRETVDEIIVMIRG